MISAISGSVSTRDFSSILEGESVGATHFTASTYLLVRFWKSVSSPMAIDTVGCHYCNVCEGQRCSSCLYCGCDGSFRRCFKSKSFKICGGMRGNLQVKFRSVHDGRGDFQRHQSRWRQVVQPSVRRGSRTLRSAPN